MPLTIMFNWAGSNDNNPCRQPTQGYWPRTQPHPTHFPVFVLFFPQRPGNTFLILTRKCALNYFWRFRLLPRLNSRIRVQPATSGFSLTTSVPCSVKKTNKHCPLQRLAAHQDRRRLIKTSRPSLLENSRASVCTWERLPNRLWWHTCR